MRHAAAVPRRHDALALPNSLASDGGHSHPLADAHLERNAILIGQGARFELWDEQRWDERRDEWLNAGHPADLLPPELGSLSL